jgi:hypothetical protein
MLIVNISNKPRQVGNSNYWAIIPSRTYSLQAEALILSYFNENVE